MEAVIAGVVSPLILAGLVAIGRWVRTILRQLEQVHALAVDVNSAVNHRPKGDPKLYDMVKKAGERAVANGEASERLEAQFADHAKNDEYNFADLRQKIGAISHAVNGRPAGSPTISDDATVSRLRDEAADAAATGTAGDQT